MTTYTVEPFDFDGSMGISYSVTRAQLGASLAPYIKVPYIADSQHNQSASDNIHRLTQKGTIKAGDTVVGFSLGTQNVSLYLSQHKPPPGVRFVLLGDTMWRNSVFVNAGVGIPWNIANEVIMIAHEFDGWSDWPDKTSSPNYGLAAAHAAAGMNSLHNYVTARMDDPSYVIAKRGNITAKLIPTTKLPGNIWMRNLGMHKQADDLDAQQRPLIQQAYSRPSPTPAQLAAAARYQVGIPPEQFAAVPQPVADIS